MTWLITGLAFLIGMIVGVQLIGALYAWIDLWYNLKQYWPLALKRTVIWCVAVLFLLWLFGPAYYKAFLLGILGEAALYGYNFINFTRKLKAQKPHAA